MPAIVIMAVKELHDVCLFFEMLLTDVVFVKAIRSTFLPCISSIPTKTFMHRHTDS